MIFDTTLNTMITPTKLLKDRINDLIDAKIKLSSDMSNGLSYHRSLEMVERADKKLEEALQLVLSELKAADSKAKGEK